MYIMEGVNMSKTEIPEEFRNEIIHGNFFNIYNKKNEEHRRLIPYKSFDLCVTDYPYGIDYQSRARKDLMPKIDGDTCFGKDMIHSASEKIYYLLRDGSHAYFFTRWDILGDLMVSTFSGFEIKNAIVIPSIGERGLGDLKYDYAPAYEMALFCQKGKREFSDTQILKKKNDKGYVKRMSNFISWLNVNTQNKWRVHPNQKSLEIYEFFILVSSNPGDWVLDPFGGSGLCAVACEDLGRNYVVFERNEHYYNEAIKFRERYREGKLDDMVEYAHERLNLDKPKQVTLTGF